MKKYAIIGFGPLGKVIFNNLMKIEKIRGDINLVGICDKDASSLNKNIKINIDTEESEAADFSQVNFYTDYKEMIEKESLDFVFIAVPNFLHCEISTYCLNHGIDVYVEKPMAITMKQCELMMNTAKKTGKKLMVGVCLRFSNEYNYLKKLVETKKFGKVIKAEFFRKSPCPDWSAGNWMLDEKKSGGCIVDMHIHDADIVLWLFGGPDKAVAFSTHYRSDFESVFATYQYPDKVVSVISDWGISASYKFKAGYSVTFENAYIECINGKVTVFTKEKSEEIEFDDNETPYYKEAKEFVDCVVEDKAFPTVTIESVYEAMKLIFKEKNEENE